MSHLLRDGHNSNLCQMGLRTTDHRFAILAAGKCGGAFFPLMATLSFHCPLCASGSENTCIDIVNDGNIAGFLNYIFKGSSAKHCTH